MPTFTSDQLVSDLHETNRRLLTLLESIVPASALPRLPARVATPKQMTELLSELMRAGQWLRNLPADRDPALEKELGEYRRLVERLRELLPSIHAALLRERARIEQERERVRSAAAWAQSSRQTL